MSMNEMESKIRELRQLQALIDEATAEAEAIKDTIKAEMGDAEELRACHYILDTGHMRGCPVSACTINTRATRRTTKGAAA